MTLELCIRILFHISLFLFTQLIFSSSFEKYNRLWQNKFDLNHNSWVVRRTQNGVKHSEFKTYHVRYNPFL